MTQVFTKPNLTLGNLPFSKYEKPNNQPQSKKEALKMLQPTKFIYRNIYIVLRLYALISVPIAGAEPSFSILKLIKTYLHNRTSDERFSDLVVINIHENIARELNSESIIDEFAKSKCRLSFTNEFN